MTVSDTPTDITNAGQLVSLLKKNYFSVKLFQGSQQANAHFRCLRRQKKISSEQRNIYNLLMPRKYLKTQYQVPSRAHNSVCLI